MQPSMNYTRANSITPISIDEALEKVIHTTNTKIQSRKFSMIMLNRYIGNDTDIEKRVREFVLFDFIMTVTASMNEEDDAKHYDGIVTRLNTNAAYRDEFERIVGLTYTSLKKFRELYPNL